LEVGEDKNSNSILGMSCIENFTQYSHMGKGERPPEKEVLYVDLSAGKIFLEKGENVDIE
jgi:hypothetical protein